MKKLTREQANSLIAEKISDAKVLLKEAEKLANEHALSFDWNMDHYGMSGTFYGKGTSWNDSSCYADEEGSEEHGWRTSSDDC